MDRDGALALLDSCLTRIRRLQSSRRTARMHAERSGVDISPLSLSIIWDLHHNGPARVTELARRVGTEIARVSREIRVLEESRHLSVHTGDTDGRARVVDLTAHGADQVIAYRRAARAILGERLADWDDESIAAFAELFDRFLGMSQAEPAAESAAEQVPEVSAEQTADARARAERPESTGRATTRRAHADDRQP
jgi:DNA-binding MarR family transcriptional regulator